MPSPFQVAGAAPEKASKFAPLLIDEFFTGQYSNSNPLRESAVPLLYRRFYSGSRYDTIRYGSNVEISPRLTIIRRPGASVYNSQSFSGILTYYAFRVIDPTTDIESIRVIVDTPTAVYDATGPSTKTLLFTKSAGAGQTSFQSVGNVLYAADGTSTWKWVWFPMWQPLTTYTTGTIVTDSNGNLQQLTSVQLSFPGNTQLVQVVSNICYIYWKTNASWTPAQLSQLPGTQITLSGFSGASFLNGNTVTIATATNSFGGGGSSTALLSFPFSNANYGPTSDTGTVLITSGNGTSSGSAPAWSTSIGGVTVDGSMNWTEKGPEVEDIGIFAPLNAPTVVNLVNTNIGSSWAASTYYNPSLCIVDSNNNIQLLTAAGTTGTVPAWSSTPGVNTTDGSATWTCQGPSARATNHAYNIGALIAVTYSFTVTIAVPITGGPQRIDGSAPTRYYYKTVTYGPYFHFFQCTSAGTSSAAATSTFAWQAHTISDGTVTWTNLGPWITRTASANAGGNAAVKGNITNSQLVETAIQIVDSNGNFQNISVAGDSGGAHPTWATASGSATIDNQATWVCGGPATSGNTGAWQYGYSFRNSVTTHEGSMSPASGLIVLGAGNLINVSGNGDPNFATDGADTIIIYRTVQGASATQSGGTFFRLTSIPAPLNGGPWSYQDITPDPPAAGSILNPFIIADTTGANAPPPAGLTNLTFYLSRLFGSAGTIQYFSGVTGQPLGVGAESWPGLNFDGMPEKVTRSWPSATGLLIFTTHGVHFSSGIDSNGNPNTPVQILEDIGLSSTNLFTVNGSIPVILSADSQMLALDPSAGLTRYSDPIADSTNGMGGFSTSSSYLTWHVNGIDTAFYLADGTTGWFRLCPTASPESGFTWSPKANLATGCGAIKSIETVPGTKNLLISTGAGPILKRDLSLNSDDTLTYAASFVMGSFVFAHPGQCAEIRSISTFTTAVGSRIAVSVLGSEIAPSVQTPFETIPLRVPEPDFLNPANSLYADRWYFNQVHQPAWLQHMQLKFDWPAEDQPNELLMFAVYGAVHL